MFGVVASNTKDSVSIPIFPPITFSLATVSAQVADGLKVGGGFEVA